MTVFLDIGATLVTGPDAGPAKRLAHELALDANVKARLSAAMMTQDWTCAEEFLAWLADEFGSEWKQTSHQAAACGLWQVQGREVRPIEGAREAMTALLDAGLPVGLISNIWHPYFEGARRCFGGLFERAAETAPQLLSFRSGTAKPEAAIYERALAACGLGAAETVMVGDTYETDMAPAMALGMATVWVLHRPEAERQHLTDVERGTLPHPDLIVDSIAQVTPERIREVLGWPKGGSVHTSAHPGAGRDPEQIRQTERLDSGLRRNER